MKSKTVLFIGDINVDLIMGGLRSPPQLDKEITCETFEVTMGSSAVIAACAYVALGGKARFLGLAGRDDYGEFMLRGLREHGVDTRLVRRTDKVRTGLTVNLIWGRTRSQVTYPGTIAEFDGTGLGGEIFRGIDHAHFAGPYQQPKFRPHIARLLRAAKTRGVTTSLDPQWDPTGEWSCVDEWLPLLTYLFVNEDEARSMTATRSPQEALKALAVWTACPIVKGGKKGAFIMVDGNVTRIPTYRTKVVDTTGAGDTFDAGFLFARLVCGWDVPRAVAFANAAGARSCSFVGGVAARSSRGAVLKFMRRPYERV